MLIQLKVFQFCILFFNYLLCSIRFFLFICPSKQSLCKKEDNKNTPPLLKQQKLHKFTKWDD